MTLEDFEATERACFLEKERLAELTVKQAAELEENQEKLEVARRAWHFSRIALNNERTKVRMAAELMDLPEDKPQ